MSSALAFAGVSAVLRDLIDTWMIDNQVATQVGQGITVSAVAPDVIQLGSDMAPRVNVFMHQTTPSAAWRNAGYPSRGSDGQRISNAPLAVDLHYLITAYANADLQAEVLIGYAMQLLNETPVLPRDMIRRILNPPTPSPSPVYQALRASDLADQYEQIKITPSVMNTEELSKLWTAIQSHYRPTAAYQVTVVLVESKRQSFSALPVLTRNLPLHASGVSPIPEVASVAYASSQIAARLGESITLNGHDLDGTGHTLLLWNTQLDFSQSITGAASVTSDAVSFTIPNAPTDVPAGIHSAQLRLVRDPQQGAVLTSAFPLTIAPEFTAPPSAVQLDANGEFSLTASCTPLLRSQQQVSMLIGGFEAFAEPFGATTTMPTFNFSGVTAGTYRARLRVDGVDSIIIDRSKTPPVFRGATVVVSP